MSWVAVAVGTVSAVSAYSSTEANNKAQGATQDNTRRRYSIQSGVSRNQMEDINTNAMTKMTNVSRKFLLAKSSTDVGQAESGVSGNVRKRLNLSIRGKASEQKSAVAREADTSIINVANDMIGKKIDTEAILAKAEADKVTGLALYTKVASAGVQGYAQGKSLDGLGGGGTGSGGNTNLEAVGVSQAGAKNYDSLASWENDIFE